MDKCVIEIHLVSGKTIKTYAESTEEARDTFKNFAGSEHRYIETIGASNMRYIIPMESIDYLCYKEE